MFFGLTVNESYERLCNLLYSLCDEFVPVSFHKKHVYNFKLKSLHAKCFQMYRKEGNSEGYKKLHKYFKRELWKSLHKKEEKIISSGNTRNFYKLVKNRLTERPTIGPILSPDGRLLTNNIDISEAFLKKFANFPVLDNGIIPPFPPRTSCTFDVDDFLPHEIESVLKALPSKNSNSPDKLPPILLKACATSLAMPLSIIFQKSLNEGRLPDLWKQGIVVPIHKKSTLFGR